MLARKARLRPHIGKCPMKFMFRAQDITVQLPGLDISGKIVLVWKRGPRRTPTEPFEVKESLSAVDGSLKRSASTSQDLALICTMFKNTRAGRFEPKTAAFTLREETDEGPGRKLGTAYVDLACYATPEPSNDAVELSMLDGKVLISFTMQSHWLKQMGADDDDTVSVSSCGSFASSARTGASSDDDIANIASLGLGTPARPVGGSRLAPAAAERAPHGEAGSYAPMDAAARARADAERERAIEDRWTQEEAKARGIDEAELLREESRLAMEKLSASLSETKRLKEEVKRLSHENRVLRREPRNKGTRDEVVTQLQTELTIKETERAEMEESLSRAFGGLLNDAHARIAALTTERDRLLVALESASGKKGGFHLG